jgi:nucleoside-triphosphate--adenylate kinase
MHCSLPTQISTGDLLRKNINEKTDIGLSAQSYMKAGKLVPDDVVMTLLKNEVTNLSNGKSVLLDGFPRTTHQAAKLGEFFKIDAVISLDIPHQVIIERLGNRWIHQPSSRTYSYDYNPPKVKGTYTFSEQR